MSRRDVWMATVFQRLTERGWRGAVTLVPGEYVGTPLATRQARHVRECPHLHRRISLARKCADALLKHGGPFDGAS